MSENYGARGAKRISRSGWDAQQGDFIETVYEGTREYVNSLFAPARLSYGVLAVETENEGPLYRLRVRSSVTPTSETDQNSPENTVRIQVNRVQKSIFEPPGPAGITAGQLRVIKKALAEDLENATPASFLAANILPGSDAYTLYQLALSGVDYRVVYQPVLYRTRTAPAGFKWADRSNGVGYNLSLEDMMADAVLGNILNFPLPTNDALVNWVDESGTAVQFAYGWVKHAPYYDTAAGNRTVEYLEYEYGLWPVLMYPLF